jgi:hypothetical protein
MNPQFKRSPTSKNFVPISIGTLYLQSFVRARSLGGVIMQRTRSAVGRRTGVGEVGKQGV